MFLSAPIWYCYIFVILEKMEVRTNREIVEKTIKGAFVLRRGTEKTIRLLSQELVCVMTTGRIYT